MGCTRSAAACGSIRLPHSIFGGPHVYWYGAKAAQHCGAIRAALEKLGQPIGVNDLLIAAHARSEGLVLVTNNMSEFERAPALATENWLADCL